MAASLVFAVVFLSALAVLLAPRVRRNPTWDATVTPLASIIGSGFLISAPLLERRIGDLALPAMAGLTLIAYAIGATIRFNITQAEPLLEKDPPAPVRIVEDASHAVLAAAYFVSVAYYLMLLSTFLLKALGVTDPSAARIVTTAILAAIGSLGYFRGLHDVERVEAFSVGTNLAVIAGLLAALAWFNAAAAVSGTWSYGPPARPFTLETALSVLGLLIVVQGFETSRFLGAEYDAPHRVRTMRRAQLASMAIYLAFFALLGALPGGVPADTGVAAIIDMVRPVAVILPVMLTIGAVASQFSASVADSIGAAGLIEEVSGHRVTPGHAYPIVAAVAIAVTWATDVFGIINLASRAFALFYLLQCGVALAVLHHRAELPRRAPRAALFGAAGLICLVVVLFAVPSGA